MSESQFSIAPFVIWAPLIGGQILYTNTARRGPPQTPWRLFGVYVFSFFLPWKQAFWYTPNLFFACWAGNTFGVYFFPSDFEIATESQRWTFQILSYARRFIEPPTKSEDLGALVGTRTSTQNFFWTEFFKNPSGHGCPLQEAWTSAPESAFSCGPGGGEKLFDPWASGRKGQEGLQEIRTKKFMFVLFCFPDLGH